MFCADNDSFWVVGQTTGDVLGTKQDLKIASMLFLSTDLQVQWMELPSHLHTTRYSEIPRDLAVSNDPLDVKLRKTPQFPCHQSGQPNHAVKNRHNVAVFLQLEFRVGILPIPCFAALCTGPENLVPRQTCHLLSFVVLFTV